MGFSLIIPTLNSAKKLRRLLAAVNAQTLKPDEIIVVDSSSGDNTAAVARSLGASVLEIPRQDFDHGGTRTLGGKRATGEILLYMTDDALPADNDSFKKLLSAFEDPKIGAACGRQLPAENAEPLAEHLRLFNYPAASYKRTYEDREKYGIKTAFLSDSFCAYRRCALEQAGWFRQRLILGEDLCAGLDILKGGWALAYQADAAVRHSHNYTARQEFARYFDIGVFHARETAIFSQLGRAEGEGVRYVISALKFLWPRLWLYPGFFLRVLAKYSGYRLGLAHNRLPKSWRVACSMHKRWWAAERD